MTVLGLTPRQVETMKFVEDYIATCGAAPTLEEIGAALGTTSKSRVHAVLTCLRDRGYVTWQPRLRRSLAVLRPMHGRAYALPPQIEAMLAAHCRRTGEEPAAVIADAVELFLDELAGQVAA